MDESPLIVPIEQLAAGHEREEMFDVLDQLVRGYRNSLEFDRRVLLEDFELTDFARKGGRGRERRHARVDRADARPRRPGPLFLQMKEAEASVTEEFLGRSESLKPRRTSGSDSVDAGHQRHLLGWLHVEAGLDGSLARSTAAD